MPQIKEGEVSLAVFWELAKAWLIHIQENVNPSLVIYAYCQNDPIESNAIQCLDTLNEPKLITQLWHYFNNLCPTNKEGFLYLNICIGFTEAPVPDTIQDMHAVSLGMAQVYLSPLQVADMGKIWLVTSISPGTGSQQFT